MAFGRTDDQDVTQGELGRRILAEHPELQPILQSGGFKDLSQGPVHIYIKDGKIFWGPPSQSDLTASSFQDVATYGPALVGGGILAGGGLAGAGAGAASAGSAASAAGSGAGTGGSVASTAGHSSIWNTIAQIALPVAGQVFGTVYGANAAQNAANTQASASEKAAEIQAGTAQNALDFQKQIYNQRRTDLQPSITGGNQALSRLDYLLGLTPQGGSSSAMPPQPVPSTQGPPVKNIGMSPGNVGMHVLPSQPGMVTLRAPDGDTRQTTKEIAQSYIQQHPDVQIVGGVA